MAPTASVTPYQSEFAVKETVAWVPGTRPRRKARPSAVPVAAAVKAT